MYCSYEQAKFTSAGGSYYGPYIPVEAVEPSSWHMLKMQLLRQWPELSEQDIQSAGPDRRRLSRIISAKYRISEMLVENYLRNFERTIHHRMSRSHKGM